MILNQEKDSILELLFLEIILLSDNKDKFDINLFLLR